MSVSGPTTLALLEKLQQLKDWYMFGRFLKLPPEELDQIERRHQSLERCKAEVCDQWLRCNPEASWEQVAVALSKSGQEALAKEIRKSQSSEKVISKLKNERTSMLDSSVLRVELEETRVHEFRSLEKTFNGIMYDIVCVLEKKKVPLINLQRYLGFCLEHPVTTQANSIDEVFQQINSEYSFLNTTLLEDLVEQFLGNNRLKVRLQEYKKRLEAFTSSTNLALLKAVQSHTPPIPLDKSQVLLKLRGFWNKVTIKRFQELVQHIFYNTANGLSHIRVTDGCISVSWLIHKSAISYLVCSAQGKVEFMRLVGVLRLVVGGTSVVDEEEDKDTSLEDALHHASSSKCVEAVRLLLSLGADPNTSEDGSTPLMAACEAGSLGIASVLLDGGADPNMQGKFQETALMKAVLRQDEALVKIMLQSGADVNLKTISRGTALMFAAEKGYPEIAQQLLIEGAILDSQQVDGRTALMFGCHYGHYNVVALLLSKGANLNIQANDGTTALMCACWQQHVTVVELLLANRADPNIQDCVCCTALMVSCEVSVDPSIPVLLLSAGADPHALSIGRSTALMIAALKGYQPGVEILLSAKVDVNIQNIYGCTALHYSAQEGHYSITELLLVAGARTSLQTRNHETAIDIAIAGHHDDVCQLLLAHVDTEPPTHLPETQRPPTPPLTHQMEHLHLETQFRQPSSSSSPQSISHQIREAMLHPLPPMATDKHDQLQQEDDDDELICKKL